MMNSKPITLDNNNFTADHRKRIGQIYGMSFDSLIIRSQSFQHDKLWQSQEICFAMSYCTVLRRDIARLLCIPETKVSSRIASGKKLFKDSAASRLRVTKVVEVIEDALGWDSFTFVEQKIPGNVSDKKRRTPLDIAWENAIRRDMSAGMNPYEIFSNWCEDCMRPSLSEIKMIAGDEIVAQV